MRRSLTLWQTVIIVAAANVAGAWLAAVFEFWSGHYFVLGAALAFGFGILLSIPLAVIAYLRIEEAAAIIFGSKAVRLIGTTSTTPNSSAPKVSIHIPAHNELPDVLKQTLDAVARLDYQNFECVLVINNTPDPAMWRPVEEHCRLLGDRFKFVRAENLAVNAGPFSRGAGSGSSRCAGRSIRSKAGFFKNARAGSRPRCPLVARGGREV